MALKSVGAWVILLGLVAAGCDGRVLPPEHSTRAETTSSVVSPSTGPIPSREPLAFDCLGHSSDCPAIVIEGDPPATMPGGQLAPFRGYSDPTVREDPATGRLWLAYSRPSIEIDNGRPMTRVETYLAHSDDGGRTWTSDGVLWGAFDATNPLNGAEGFVDTEVPNLLLHREGDSDRWYGVRLQLFVPAGQGLGNRPITSFRIAISAAPSPLELATAPAVLLGAAGTLPAWGIAEDLTDLDPSLRECMAWNEPALALEDGQLYLALRCLSLTPGSGQPRVDRSPIVLFATTPSGEPEAWTWRYVGELAGHDEATELGGVGLTQIDFAEARDGTLLAIVTPDDWSTEANEFVHYGIRVLEVESLGLASLARDMEGMLVVRASVTASDQVPLGPGAAAYDPASATGILLMRRVIETASLVASIHATGVHP